MTNAHTVHVGWAGYLRKAVCSCGWAGARWKDLRHAEREAEAHRRYPSSV
jgi:hypothetical protein